MGISEREREIGESKISSSLKDYAILLAYIHNLLLILHLFGTRFVTVWKAVILLFSSTILKENPTLLDTLYILLRVEGAVSWLVQNIGFTLTFALWLLWRSEITVTEGDKQAGRQL